MKEDLIEHIVRIEKEAEAFGFKWTDPHQILKQIQSECGEIEENLSHQGSLSHLQEEVGDLMHATFSLCVFLDLDPETTLIKSMEKLERRLKEVRRLAVEQGLGNLHGHSFEMLMSLWDQAKKQVG